MPERCPFCMYSGPSEVLWDMRGCFVIEPLNPVTPGHVLVIPRQHVKDAFQDTAVTGRVFEVAAMYAKHYGQERDVNLITSVGRLATQSVQHLHVHVVPRRQGDGLSLPWTGGMT